MKFESRRK